MHLCHLLPILSDQLSVVFLGHAEDIGLEIADFLVSPLFSDVFGFEVRVSFEQAADSLAAPFIRVRDPLSIIPFLFIDLMEEPLMNIAIGVYGLESELFWFDFSLKNRLTRNVFIIVPFELGAFRSERRMFEYLQSCQCQTPSSGRFSHTVFKSH
jgi:hypothetical protein